MYKTQDYYDVIARLLRAYQAIHNLSQKELIDYLNENYNLQISSAKEMSQIINYPLSNSNRIKNNVFEDAWPSFMFQEREALKAMLHSRGDFKNNYQYSYKSGGELISRNWSGIKYLVSWNSYIDPYEWATPDVQMHMMHLLKVGEKINTSRKGNVQFRILLLHYTTDELTRYFENSSTFSTEMIYALKLNRLHNVNLAYLTIDTFSNIIKSNHDFFNDEKRLNALGIKKPESLQIRKGFKDDMKDITSILQSILKAKSYLPENSYPIEGIDFLQGISDMSLDNTDQNSTIFIAHRLNGQLEYKELIPDGIMAGESSNRYLFESKEFFSKIILAELIEFSSGVPVIKPEYDAYQLLDKYEK